MIIKEEVLSKVEKDYLFLVGTLKISNIKYFIDEIDQGVKEHDNNNFKTNVIGHMTSWKYFSKDPKFLKMIYPILDKVDQYSLVEQYTIKEAWGLKESFGGRTVEHNHPSCVLSVVIYFNNHPQELFFPEINKKVKPEKGKFVVFSGFLNHRAERITCNKSKYAIAFNFEMLTYSN